MLECFDGPAASQQGMLGALIVWWPASFWLQWTMAEGTVHTGSPAKFPTKPTEEWKKNRKMYAIKQIKICAEYRDMLPRPRLDLSGTPGLRPIGLSPGSWQTSLGLGSMSRYSAQILICITCVCVRTCVSVRMCVSVCRCGACLCSCGGTGLIQIMLSVMNHDRQMGRAIIG